MVQFYRDIYHKAFEDTEKAIDKETILNYPNFNEEFEIHKYGSDRQLGAVISQNGELLVVYSRKLSNTQRNWTTTEKEVLNIVGNRWGVQEHPLGDKESRSS